jgi:DNA-binding response OmpR family regulator
LAGLGMSVERLKFLIVDDQPFQRRLIAETLRTLGSVRLEQAENTEQCFEILSYFMPDILITDWDMATGDGIALVKRLRAGDAGVTMKKLPVVMIAERNKAEDIETARNCGIDEFLLRPFSTAALFSRVEAVTRNRRDFIESSVYTGPCRRRKMLQDYEGPLRRLFDEDGDGQDAPEIQMKKGLTRAYLERVGVLMGNVESDPVRAMRDIFLAAGQLRALATDMKDKLLIAAAESLFNYVQGVGASPRLDTDVADAHIKAMLQLVDLPNSQIELRTTVTRELGVMVRKKLKTGVAA